jgi:hypothetical protein
MGLVVHHSSTYLNAHCNIHYITPEITLYTQTTKDKGVFSSLFLFHHTFAASRCRGREARGGVTVSFGNSSSIVAMISLESLMNEPSGSWRGVSGVGWDGGREGATRE